MQHGRGAKSTAGSITLLELGSLFRYVGSAMGAGQFQVHPTKLLANPIFNTQSRHTFELSYVVGNQYEFVGKCM